MRKILMVSVALGALAGCSGNQHQESSDVLQSSGLSLPGICYDLKDPVAEVGPVKLFEPATIVCTSEVSKHTGRSYYSLAFADEQGILARLATQEMDFSRGRCVDICMEYEPSSGNSNGQNVQIEGSGTRIKLDYGSKAKKLTITFDGVAKEYELERR